ncbi:Uncharacterised protein [Escherichia coli]|nr:Uncharacterised protein [Escherichia coli]CAD6110958.1 Uncharacterised protein [Escherichia coli]CAD6180943.1 Uncharacterised protein [Escherichia coli]
MILFKRTQIRGKCPECGTPLIFVIPVWGIVVRWIFLAFTLYLLYLAAGMGVHLWDVWHPVSGEKTESPHLETFVGGLVILSLWVCGAIPAVILMYFSRARLRTTRIS